ncbi:MAG: aldehyde ferredoxin oxidoreductase family protein [Candidatus Bathyarchaeota archaeon]|jgi:aldehyde:ferredoxin oxidoreductase|nr:aldehyde ferredoxin oxidoreductase family protein [Candidatus Bathyarchaeota archaeon]
MSKLGGYTGKVLRINLTKRISTVTELEKTLAWGFLGGRGFNVKRMYDEIPTGTDPLGPENKLYFAPGPLVGTSFPTASRFNISGKSPQTGILGDTNAGGHLASEIKYAGYDQIILEGRSTNPIYIHIRDDDVEFPDASHLKGRGVYETDEIIKSDLGDRRVQTAIIGPAAENGVRFAGIFANLMRAAARTGMGSVMASKGVKALVVRGTGSVSVAKPRMFEELVDYINEQIKGHEQYQGRRSMGTTRILLMANAGGFLPTRHYTAGTFKHAAEVSGERLAEEFNVKGRGCFACTIPCSRFYVVKSGEHAGLYGEGPEYESQGSFTSRIGNRSLETALKANDLCNRLGLDILTTAESIAWVMELYEKEMLSSEEADGLDLSWGNEETILTLINKIALREGFGDVLADGTTMSARKLGRGIDLTMQVKGLDIIMADPRGLKGFGLGYAVSSRGGDHLRSEPFLELVDDPAIGEKMFGIPDATMRRAYRGKGKLVSYFEDWNAVIDSLQPCKNIMQNMEILTFDLSSKVIEATTGIQLTPTEVRGVGERIVNIERAFNVKEGMRRKDDTLPRRFREEPLIAGESRGTVFELEPMLDEYYGERGWDLKTGIPTSKTLRRLGLNRAANDLSRLK